MPTQAQAQNKRKKLNDLTTVASPSFAPLEDQEVPGDSPGSGGIPNTGGKFLTGLEGLPGVDTPLNFNPTPAKGIGGVPGSKDFLAGLFKGGNTFNPAFLNNINNTQNLGAGQANRLGSNLDRSKGNLDNFITGQGNQLLNSIFPGILDGTGGGNSVSFGASSGGGQVFNSGNVRKLFENLPDFVPRKIDTDLGELSPETLKKLDAIAASEEADLRKARKETEGNLLTSLFGRGINRSSVAGDAAGRTAESLDRSLLAAKSQDAARRLDVLKEGADRSLTAQLGLLGEEGSTFRSKLDAAARQKLGEIDATSRTASAALGASASANAARSSLEAARLGALSDIFRTQTSGLSNSFGTASGLQGDIFGALQANNRGFQNINAGLAQSELENNTNIGRIGADVFNSAGNRALQSSLGQQGLNLDFAQLNELRNNRLQQGLLTREDFQNQRELAQLGFENNKPSFFDKLIGAGGVAGTILAGLSDKRMKENVSSVGTLQGLHWYTFNYKNNSNRFMGVMAQEIPQEYVVKHNDLLYVDYGKLLKEM